MSYTKTKWVNVPDPNSATDEPKLDADNLNKMEQGIYDAHAEILGAMVSSDGTNYTTLKARLDTENSELKSDLSGLGLVVENDMLCVRMED